MRKILLLLLLTFSFVNATEYSLIHLKKGGAVNVREEPIINRHTLVGKLPADTIGIKIRECKYNIKGEEWCYVYHGVGTQHVEGWVSRRFLQPMKENREMNRFYIKYFLEEYYKADEENFLDKLKVFYTFPMQQYMLQKNVTLMNLRASKVRFYKYWPKRKYSLGYLRILKQKRDYTDVEVTVHWKYESRNDSRSGRDINKIRIVKEDGEFKVLAIKRLEQIINPKVIELEEDVDGKTVAVEKEPKEEVAIKKDASTKGTQKYYIKVGSFIKEPKASYLNKIVSFGFKYKIEKIINEDKILRRVYIGPFKTTVETMEALDRIRKKINKNAYIQTLDN